MESVKISYFRDPQEPKRVMTVVRTLNKDTDVVKYSISVNTPRKHYKWQQSVGDVFSKQKGRLIAEGRLNKDPRIISASGERPIVAILQDLSFEDGLVGRIAGGALKEILEKVRNNSNASSAVGF